MENNEYWEAVETDEKSWAEVEQLMTTWILKEADYGG